MRLALRLIGLVTVLLFTIPALAQSNDMGGNQNGMSGDQMMGGDQMLGGDAQTTTLAEQQLDTLPEEPLAWVGFDLSGIEGEINITSPAPGFLYANEGSHTVTVDGEEMTLDMNEATFVPEGAEVSLMSGQGLWHIVLTDPEADAPDALADAEVIFSSGELEGIPEPPVQLSFVLVELPMGSHTSVHTHPGPEYIYVTQGEIEYQNAIIGTQMMAAGDDHALPANTAVQKRNPMGDTAVFLSWFVVDPDQPFASEASFE